MSTEYKDHGWMEYQRRAEKLSKATLKIGILSDAGNHDDEELTIAEIAAINEFGSDDDVIPERPAHRNTFEKKKGDLRKRMEGSARLILSGKVSQNQQLDKLGLWYVGELRNEIIAFDDPPNAESTQKRKGAKVGKGVLVDNPLVDTGRTLNSIQHKIGDDDD